MLKRLQINNYALIHQAEVDFPGQLTVITGETGAGKSIFLDALGLVLGQRADQSALASKSRKCVVEAEFDVEALNLEDFFSEHDLSGERILVLRRELGADGRSRSLVNDQVVTIAAMKQLAGRLVDVHSQHQTLNLNKSGFQLSVLDAFAGTESKFALYRSTYAQLQSINSEIEKLKGDEASARKELDYLQFLFSELSDARIVGGELKNLEELSESLENAEQIRSSLLQASDALSGDGGHLGGMAHVRQSIQSLSRYGSVYVDLAQRLSSLYIELKEIASDLQQAGEAIAPDRGKLEETNARIDLINRLMRKHGVNDEKALLNTQEEIGSRLEGHSSMETRLQALEKERQVRLSECIKLAGELSAMRRKAIPALEKRVADVLMHLGMPNARFVVNLETGNVPGPHGFDEVTILFNANKGGAVVEISKVASGGELSRLMLAVKSLMAEKKSLSTIIFDEIDTGVSGEVADRIGNILLKMSEGMQVIAITHLPQLASKGSHHLFVYKEERDSATVSHIRELKSSERVNEIAKMLSRGRPTETALNNARELLKAH